MAKSTYLDTVITKFNDSLCNKSINSKSYGEGIIENFYVNESKSIIAKIVFNIGAKAYDLKTALKCRFLSFNEPEATIYNELLKDVEEANKKHEEQLKILKQQEAEERKQAIEAQKLAKRLARDEEKFQQAKESLLRSFERKTKEHAELPKDSEVYYYNLGWLASHIKLIKAKLPDYLDVLFVKHFGETDSKTVIDTNRRTSGGFRPQWSYAFSCSFKNTDNAPADIISILAEGKKQINNTEFIWNLIDQHNFRFGKEQDVDSIRSSVPKSMLNWFEEGFNTK